MATGATERAAGAVGDLEAVLARPPVSLEFGEGPVEVDHAVHEEGALPLEVVGQEHEGRARRELDGRDLGARVLDREDHATAEDLREEGDVGGDVPARGVQEVERLERHVHAHGTGSLRTALGAEVPARSHTAAMGPLRVSRSIVVPERELRWRFSHASGPGGQSVNTADTRVELSLDLERTTALGPVQRTRALERLAGRLVDGVLTVTSQAERSQLRNREAAMERMAAILAKAVKPPPPKRKPTGPTRAATERRLAEKRRRSRTKLLRRVDDDDA